MKPSYRFYRFGYRVCRILLGIVYRLNFIGRENIPEGAALVCVNHSSVLDPILTAFAFGIGTHIRVIAKHELFKIPVLSAVVKLLGAISVKRGATDVEFLKGVISCLKNDAKVVIFPEGTRIAADDADAAKSGSIRIAERAGVPMIPIYIPRRKPLFHKLNIVIGKPSYIEKSDAKRSKEDYLLLSKMLMDDIYALDVTAESKSIRSAELIE